MTRSNIPGSLPSNSKVKKRGKDTGDKSSGGFYSSLVQKFQTNGHFEWIYFYLLSSMSVLAASKRFCKLSSVSVCLSLRRFSWTRRFTIHYFTMKRHLGSFPPKCFWLPAATPYQDLHRWGLDGDVDGVEVSLLDVFHSLYVNIENADEVLCLDIFNSRFTVES